MKDAAPQTIYLDDYTPPAFLVDEVHMTFKLAPKGTRVVSRIKFRPNPASESRDFFLHGEDVQLLRTKIDGNEIKPNVTAIGLRCAVPYAPFEFETEVLINPADNTALEGLYMSNGMYCTQCEAEGFRKITFYPDRPDVMATFTVRIEADLPVLLSNGNPTDQGDGWAEWHDPWPKPSYLFALVAGDLVNRADHFTTRSGAPVDLNIWVRPGDEGKCDFAMQALKKSMTWDEDVYGREYDLDVFNIVAVDDFNAGAMENKGLNIFNSAAVLASPETATDANFQRIETIIAHEYFHNWTGNRITCRDWFQLCLKEGLTVFRDQQFTGDMRGHAVKRIDDAIDLRAGQFREDAGPLAHPVRPDRFVEINNFYTDTVYDKGAEVIGMLKRLVGDADYDKALDLYFTRHDGDAATIEDWLQVFEDITGRDLTQFARWYHQAGTPRVKVTENFSNGTYRIDLKQDIPSTPDQSDKQPQVIPIAIGLLDTGGNEILPTTLLEMTQAEQHFDFDGLKERPILSALRGFSAPINLQLDQTNETRAALLAHDTDAFNRWEAGHRLARSILHDMVANNAAPDQGFLDGLGAVLSDNTLDPAFSARLLRLPSEEDTAQHLAQAGHTPDPIDIHRAHETLKLQIATQLQDLLHRTYAAMAITDPYQPDAASAGKRALGNAALSLLTRLDGGKQASLQYTDADNMTQHLAALTALLKIGKGKAELAEFEQTWAADRLVMDKWFAMQVSCAAPEDAAPTAERLAAHTAFDLKNPNRVRAVFGSLTSNTAGFHDSTGAAYDLMADWLIKLDAINPQITARLSTAFDTWRRYDTDRQSKMRAALQRIADTPGLSGDTGEMVTRLLSAE